MPSRTVLIALDGFPFAGVAARYHLVSCPANFRSRHSAAHDPASVLSAHRDNVSRQRSMNTKDTKDTKHFDQRHLLSVRAFVSSWFLSTGTLRSSKFWHAARMRSASSPHSQQRPLAASVLAARAVTDPEG